MYPIPRHLLEKNYKPELSNRFDVDDIRKIREYNSLRHIHMTPTEIIAETQAGAEKVLQMLEQSKLLGA